MKRMIVTSLVALAVLAGCSAQDDAGVDDLASPDAEADGVEVEATDDAAPEAAEDADRSAVGARGSSGETVRTASRAAGRKVIRTAEIELVSQDTDETAEEVMRLADRSGGFVATTDLRRDDEDLLRGTVTVRVPSADLVEVLRELEDLAVRAPVSRIDERDVTDETSDLEARRTNLTGYEQELRTLLADVREDTSSPDDLLRIFERIREVREEIDTIEGRLASLADQVELATVVVRIEPAPTALAVSDPTWQPVETVREALTAATRGLSRVVDAAIWLTVGVLPVLLVVAAPAVGLYAAWRRLRRRTPTEVPDAAA